MIRSKTVTGMQQESEMQLRLPGTMLKISYLPFSMEEISWRRSILNSIPTNKVRNFRPKSFCLSTTDRILGGLTVITILSKIRKCLLLNMGAMAKNRGDRMQRIRSWHFPLILRRMICYFIRGICSPRDTGMALLLPFTVRGTALRYHRRDITSHLFHLKMVFHQERGKSLQMVLQGLAR